MKAWGIFTWKGKLIHNGEERRIHGINAKGWKMLADSMMFEAQKFPQLSPDLHLEALETIPSNTSLPPL